MRTPLIFGIAAFAAAVGAGEFRVPAGGGAPREKGAAMWQCDETALTVKFHFEDSSIIAQGTADQQPHHILGEVLEIFIVPPSGRYYWEIFVTPKGWQSVYRWRPEAPGRARELLSEADLRIGAEIGVAAGSWGGRVSIPRSALEQYGETFAADGRWRILLARQNYTGKVDKLHRELSSWPALSQVDFHLLGEYAALKADAAAN